MRRVSGGRDDASGERTLLVDDAALVHAPRWLVHRRLADPASWPSWWPGLELVAPGSPPPHHVAVAVRRPWRPTRFLRLSVRPWGHRQDLGLHLVVAGDVRADAEWWLEDAGDGTIVHHLAHIDRRCRHASAWRPLVRRALWALDERLGDEVRRAVLPVDMDRRPTDGGTTN